MYSISTILFAALGLASISAACAAPENKDSAGGKVYAATFLSGSSGVSGIVTFFPDNGYVKIGVALTTVGTSQNPLKYRIHTRQPFGACDPRSSDLDPYCGDDQAFGPAEKKVGDLSGKHGLIVEPIWLNFFEDRFLSLNPNNKAYVGQMSIVVEDRNGKRLACTTIDAVNSPLSGAKAEAAKPALQLELPQNVKDLLV